MKNDLKYFYNLDIKELINSNDYYYFFVNEERYELVPCEITESEIKELINLNNINQLFHKIIINKDKSPLTKLNNINYVLLKIYINKEKKITLSEINYLANLDINSKELVRSNWSNLWEKNIDYFEYQIEQKGKKYPLIINSFSYYVGLAENAISYINNTQLENKDNSLKTISHRKIKDLKSIDCLYNPLNIIVDYKSRDLAEYIKISFFENNKNIFDELDEYFKHNYYSFFQIRILFGRILYPNYYFDLFEDIITEIVEEKEIINIISRVSEYEDYLDDVYKYLRKFYNLPEIEWLTKKRGIIPR